MINEGRRLELTLSAPDCLDALLKDEEISAFSLSADGALTLDHLRGHRYEGPSLGEAGYDAVAHWVDEHPGAHSVRYGDWRFFLSQVEEGLFYGERSPQMSLTLDDLYHLGWFQKRPQEDLLDHLARAVFIRVLGMPLWAKTLLALAIQNSLKNQIRPLLGPGPWSHFDLDDETWARTLAAKTATGAELMVTASGHLANQALHSGLKALWAPHPAYIDEKTNFGDWPVLDVFLWRDVRGQLRVKATSDLPPMAPTPVPYASPSVTPIESGTAPEQQLPAVAAEVQAEEVTTPEDWGSVDLENSPGWELGEPPEPGQILAPNHPPVEKAEVTELTLEPPPEVLPAKSE